MFNVLENGHQQCGRDGDGTGQQNPSKTGPAQVQKTLREWWRLEQGRIVCAFLEMKLAVIEEKCGVFSF